MGVCSTAASTASGVGVAGWTPNVSDRVIGSIRGTPLDRRHQDRGWVVGLGDRPHGTRKTGRTGTPPARSVGAAAVTVNPPTTTIRVLGPASPCGLGSSGPRVGAPVQYLQ